MRTLFAATALLLIAACTPAPAPRELVEPHFTAQPVVALDVGKVQFVEDYRSPGISPNVEHLFRYTPAQVFKTWVSDHIHASGGDNILEVTIKDASVVENKLPVTEGWRGWFVDEQAMRYDGKLAVEMRIYKPGSAMSDAQIDAVATRTASLPESATMVMRDQAFYDMAISLTQSASQKLDTDMRQYFAAYIK